MKPNGGLFMTKLFDLTGRVALITGGSSGLGVQFALALAGAGADVAISARRVEKLEEVKAQVEEKGVKCTAHACDVGQLDQIKRMVAEVEEAHGKIDILVNNAGIARFEPAEIQSDEAWLDTININLNAQYFVTREVVKGMIERKYGRIINIGSIHSSVAMLELPLSAYVTSKGGIKNMTLAMATEWAKHGITVNAIGPAYFPSEMTGDVIAGEDFQEVIRTRCPMGRAGRDGELDTAIIYFAAEATSYTTGQLLSVDGGWTAI